MKNIDMYRMTFDYRAVSGVVTRETLTFSTRAIARHMKEQLAGIPGISNIEYASAPVPVHDEISAGMLASALRASRG